MCLAALLALFVGQATARGEIKNVNDPFDRHTTEWRGDPRERMTLRQSLQMVTEPGQTADEYGYWVVRGMKP